MTVCVAVVAEDEKRIICVSDRMLTVGVMEFEPFTSKMFLANRALGFLYAGDSSWATEVISKTIDALPCPDSPWDLGQIARCYEASYREVLHRHIDSTVLCKFPLRMQDIMSPHPKLRPEILEEAIRLISQYEPPITEAIIAGINPDGDAELWVAQDGEVQVANVPGFVAIGAGREHALTQLMLRGWHTGGLRADALLFAYAAKRRTDEIVGGVGTQTDVFEIGPGMKTFATWRTDLVGRLENEYKKWIQGERIGFTVATLATRQVAPTPEEVLFATQQPVAGVTLVSPPDSSS